MRWHVGSMVACEVLRGVRCLLDAAVGFSEDLALVSILGFEMLSGLIYGIVSSSPGIPAKIAARTMQARCTRITHSTPTVILPPDRMLKCELMPLLKFAASSIRSVALTSSATDHAYPIKRLSHSGRNNNSCTTYCVTANKIIKPRSVPSCQ